MILQKTFPSTPSRQLKKAPTWTNFLKFLPKDLISWLCWMINPVMRLQYLPRAWKLGTVICTQIARTPSQYYSSYRPINLFSSLSSHWEIHTHEIEGDHRNQKSPPLFPIRLPEEARLSPPALLCCQEHYRQHETDKSDSSCLPRELASYWPSLAWFFARKGNPT